MSKTIYNIRRKGNEFVRINGLIIEEEDARLLWEDVRKRPGDFIVLGHWSGPPSSIEYQFEISVKYLGPVIRANLLIHPLAPHGLKYGSVFRAYWNDTCIILLPQTEKIWSHIIEYMAFFPSPICIPSTFIKKQNILRLEVEECQAIDIDYINLKIEMY